MNRNCLVVGIGNPLHGPDAFGPAVVEQLRRNADVPSTVELIDAHTDLLSCVDRFAGFDRVVLVDAFLGGGSGEVVTIDEATFSAWSTESPSSHEMSAVLVVGLFRRLYPHAPTCITLVGLDVERVRSDESLPPDVIAAGARAVARLVST